MKRTKIGLVLGLIVSMGVITSPSWAIAPQPTADQVVITFPTYGDMREDGTLGGAVGVVMHLRDATSATGLTYTQSWATCTTDADGDCSFTIPVSEASTLASKVGVVVDSDEWVDSQLMGTLLSLDYNTGGTVYHPTELDSLVLERVNPVLPEDCGTNGLNVAFVADLSGSMEGLGITTLKTALDDYVDALTGTKSQIALFTFNQVSPAAGSMNVNRPLTSVQDQAGADQVKQWINGWVPGGDTSWGQGLYKVATAGSKFDLVIVITDGESPDSTNFTTAANTIKAMGTRILVIGAGSDLVENNLQYVSGPISDSKDIKDDDYFVSDWDEVNSLLNSLATSICPSLTKVVTPPAPTASTPAPVATAPTPVATTSAPPKAISTGGRVQGH